MTTTPTLWLDSFQVNTSSTGFQGDQKIIGLSNGNFLVVYADDSGTVGSGSGRDIIGVIYDAEGTIVTTAFQVNQSFLIDQEELPSIAATNDGGFMMAYEDRNASGQSIRLERYDASGTQVDFVTVQSDPGTPFVSQPSIAVDLSDNSVFVSYQWSDGNDDSIRGKAFDSNLTVAAGTPANGHIIRSDENTSSAVIGAFDNDTTVLTNGTYVTVYTEVDNDQGIEIRGSDATTGANAFLVNVGTTGVNGVADFDPHVAALTGGGFVVVWQEDEGTNDNIVFARYNATGVLQGAVTTVVDTGNDYFQPRVIGLEDGGFFIAAVDATEDRIEGARYDASGTLVGTLMFPMESGISNAPDIDLGLTSDGRILLTWDDPSGDVRAEIWDPRDTTINADPGDGQITARISEDTTITGTASPETFFGQLGNDVLFGGGSADTIFGGDGNDTIEAGGAGDVVYGGDGDDLIRASSGAAIDVIFGGMGIDTADYDASDFAVDVDLVAGKVTGFGGTKTIDGVEHVIGTDFDDTIIADGQVNEIFGGAGNDLLQGGRSRDTIYGGSGNDTIQVLHDEVNDDVFGGGGFDVFDISDETLAGVNIDLLSGVMMQRGGHYFIVAIEEVIGTQVADTIAGGFGEQTLRGEGGDDVFTSGDGEFIDNLFGGTGTDTFDNSAQTNASGGLDIDMGTGTMSGINSGLTIDSIENVIGTTQDDTIIGDGAANSFAGGAGEDELRGGGGADTIDGGADNDALHGDAGIDALFGGGGADILFGGSDNDALIGGDGADTFFGGDGVNDLMITGDDGAVDSFFGGAGIADVVSYFSSGTGVFVNLADNTANTGAAAGETYVGVEGIRGAGAAANTLIGNINGNVLIGGSAADWISSGGGSDIVYGGAGADTIFTGDAVDILRGDEGDDTLTGGAGGDFFKMKGVDGNDTITDFAVLSDKVEFQVAGVNSFSDLVFQDLGGGNSKVTAGPVSVTFLGVALADIQQAGNFDFV